MKNFQRYTNRFKKLSLQPQDLSGKFAIVTGGNEGIGFQIALFLAKMNCTVKIIARSESKLMLAVNEIRRLSGNPEISYDVVDLGDVASVQNFTRTFLENHDKLDILINNAGALFHEFGKTLDGIERTVHVNHLGPTLLTLGLLPAIKRAHRARIVFVTSDYHLDVSLSVSRDLKPLALGYNGVSTYSKTKLMNAVTAKELSRRLAHQDILVTYVNPGVVPTHFAYSHLPKGLVGKLIGVYLRLFHLIFGRTPEQGAMTPVFAATSENVVTGEYYDSCDVAITNPLVNDDMLAKHLWSQSLELIRFDDRDVYH